MIKNLFIPLQHNYREPAFAALHPELQFNAQDYGNNYYHRTREADFQGYEMGKSPQGFYLRGDRP
jgi:hypothetical protein